MLVLQKLQMNDAALEPTYQDCREHTHAHNTHIHTRYEKLNSTRGICQQSLQGKRNRRGDKTELGWGLIREGNKEEVNLN